VEHITNTLPGFMWAAQPSWPNSTASVCAAFTTTDTTTSQAAPSSARLAQATPPSLAKASAASRRTSNTCTECPARRSEAAMPEPMAPKPIKPTVVMGVSFSRGLATGDGPAPLEIRHVIIQIVEKQEKRVFASVSRCRSSRIRSGGEWIVSPGPAADT
jgi:hypothetical protein